MKRGTMLLSTLLGFAMLPFTVGCSEDAPGRDLTGPSSSADEVTSMSIAPGSVGIELGTTYWLTAELRDAEGKLVPAGARTIHWTSSDDGIAGVSDGMARGLVITRSIGTATITATYRDLTASARVRVLPPTFEPPADGGDDERIER